MTETAEKCDTLAFYDAVDNLIEGVQNFDFSDELSSDMCDVYKLSQERSHTLLYIDYAAESITALRRTGTDEEIIVFFVSEDFTPELSANIVSITQAATLKL